MMAGSHVVLGAAAWLVAAPLLGEPALSPTALALAAGGALLPDIDHPKSWVGRRLKPISLVLGKLLGHRGITHSLAAVAGCCWLLASHGVPRAVAAPLVVGYLSHLAGDLLTPGGLRLAWPLKGTWALPLCRSGSPAEPLVIAGVLVWVWYSTEIGPWAAARLRASGACAAVTALRSLCPAPIAPLPPSAAPRSKPVQIVRGDGLPPPPARKAQF